MFISHKPLSIRISPSLYNQTRCFGDESVFVLDASITVSEVELNCLGSESRVSRVNQP